MEAEERDLFEPKLNQIDEVFDFNLFKIKFPTFCLGNKSRFN